MDARRGRTLAGRGREGAGERAGESAGRRGHHVVERGRVVGELSRPGAVVLGQPGPALGHKAPHQHGGRAGGADEGVPSVIIDILDSLSI